MIAIHTKFIAPTNNRGARIKAYTRFGWTVIIPYPYGKSGVNCDFEAVKALIAKFNLDWDISNMRYGDSADGLGYSFCFDNSKVDV